MTLDAPPAPSTHHGARAASNWKLTLAYDGTDFDGWQVQPGRRTIQGELQAAIERITGERPLPQGSGRTDAGVHALAQVASFSLTAPIPAANLERALNRALPESIRIAAAEIVPHDFHARHSAAAKTYEYRICRSRICPPWLARYVYVFPAPLDVDAMQRAAIHVLGEHDFTSFAANDPDRADRSMPATVDDHPQRITSNRRTLHCSEWRMNDHASEEILTYRVIGNGFLHHMVRNLVGTFLDVGRGLTPAEALPTILAARSRSNAGPTAPARGLFLVSVDYGPHSSSDQ